MERGKDKGAQQLRFYGERAEARLPHPRSLQGRPAGRPLLFGGKHLLRWRCTFIDPVLDRGNFVIRKAAIPATTQRHTRAYDISAGNNFLKHITGSGIARVDAETVAILSTFVKEISE